MKLVVVFRIVMVKVCLIVEFPCSSDTACLVSFDSKEVGLCSACSFDGMHGASFYEKVIINNHEYKKRRTHFSKEWVSA